MKKRSGRTSLKYKKISVAEPEPKGAETFGWRRNEILAPAPGSVSDQSKLVYIESYFIYLNNIKQVT